MGKVGEEDTSRTPVCSFFSSYFENIKCEKDFNGNFVKNVIV